MIHNEDKRHFLMFVFSYPMTQIRLQGVTIGSIKPFKPTKKGLPVIILINFLIFKPAKVNFYFGLSDVFVFLRL